MGDKLFASLTHNLSGGSKPVNLTTELSLTCKGPAWPIPCPAHLFTQLSPPPAALLSLHPPADAKVPGPSCLAGAQNLFRVQVAMLSPTAAPLEHILGVASPLFSRNCVWGEIPFAGSHLSSPNPEFSSGFWRIIFCTFVPSYHHFDGLSGVKFDKNLCLVSCPQLAGLCTLIPGKRTGAPSIWV